MPRQVVTPREPHPPARLGADTAMHDGGATNSQMGKGGYNVDRQLGGAPGTGRGQQTPCDGTTSSGYAVAGGRNCTHEGPKRQQTQTGTESYRRPRLPR